MKRFKVFLTISIWVFFIFFSCNHSIKTKRNTSNSTLASQRDSTQYVLRGDSILPPLKYKIEEMGDYPIRKGMPLRISRDSL